MASAGKLSNRPSLSGDPSKNCVFVKRLQESSTADNETEGHQNEVMQ